jgi:hypothetical protein
MKRWIKNNKKKAIIIGVVVLAVLLLVIFSFAIISYLVPNTKASVYGDRCKTTSNYQIESDREDKIKEFLKDYKEIEFKSFDVKCNLIDIVIEVKDKYSFSKVKDMSKKLLKVFTEDEYKHYDIQLMVKSDNDKSEVYPKIGTHHKEINGKVNDSFVW